jgi:hypothetical protein
MPSRSRRTPIEPLSLRVDHTATMAGAKVPGRKNRARRPERAEGSVTREPSVHSVHASTKVRKK